MPAISNIVTAVQGILHPPIFDLVEQVVPGSPFTGQGRLTRPGLGQGVNAFGIAWSFTHKPPELGVLLGEVPVWHERLLQLATSNNIRDGTIMLSAVLDVHVDASFWVWPDAFPQFVSYTLLPGVEAQFRWLIWTV